MRQQTYQWLIPVLLAIGVAGALVFYRLQVTKVEPEQTSLPAPTAVVEDPDPEPSPRYPLEKDPVEAMEAPTPVPLPPLDESDADLMLALTELLGEFANEIFVDSSLIVKLVTTIDNLPRPHVAERIRPLTPVEGLFMVDGQDASGEFAIADANYARYDKLMQLLDSTNLNEATELYRRFYPLFQQAYEDLGYPDGYFNDRLIEVVDHLLETPDISGPLELVRPHVMYEYRDSDLEALSSGQKLILRAGSEHAALIKRKLQEWRTLLTAM